MKEADYIGDLRNSKTPEELHSAIEKCLDQRKGPSLGPEDLGAAYDEARKVVRGFRKVHDGLPPLPDRRKDSVAGLEDLTEWCLAAIRVVQNIVADLDAGMLDKSTTLLNELKKIPGFGFPSIDQDLWENARRRADRIIEKYRAGKRKTSKGSSPLSVMGRSMRSIRWSRFSDAAEIISNLAEVAARRGGHSTPSLDSLVHGQAAASPLIQQMENAQTEMQYYRALERIYRMMDKTYAEGLSQLEQKIGKIIDRMNELASTPAGELLNAYEKLSGLQLQDRFDELGRVFCIDSIVDTRLFGSNLDSAFGRRPREALLDGLVETLGDISRKIKDKTRMKESENGQQTEGRMPMISARSSKDNWEAIRIEYDISKKDFGKKIDFVSDKFKRNVISRDVEQAFVLASQGFPKPAVILAGGVIEELLRLYLKHKKIPVKSDKFADYIKICEENGLLKRGVSRLTDSIRDFRNLAHLGNEKTERHTISKATAKGAVSSIFTIANDFQ